MVFIKDDTPVKFLSAESNPIEVLYIDLHFVKKKCFLSCFCHPNKNNIMNHLDGLGEIYIYILKQYEYLISLGDFNLEFKEPSM